MTYPDSVLASMPTERTSADVDLLAAAMEGSLEKVEEALRKGADVNSVDAGGESALHLAINYGRSADVASRLVAAGANLDAVDGSSRSPLHLCTLLNDADMVQHLVEHGANANIPSAVHGVPLKVASEQGYSEIVRILLAAKANPNGIKEGETTPLHCASRAEIVDLLVDAGASMEVHGTDNDTPLGYAALRGKEEVCLRLIERGSPVNAIGGGTGPLMFAARAWIPSTRVVDRLCEAGASLTEVDSEGRTPVLVASKHGYGKLCRCLILHGVDIRQLHPDDGSNLLIYAAANNDPETCALLLDLGLDPNLVNHNGHTFFDIAADKPAVRAVYDARAARMAIRAAARAGATPDRAN